MSLSWETHLLATHYWQAQVRPIHYVWRIAICHAGASDGYAAGVNDEPSSVIIAGHRFLRDPLIFYRRSQDHAVGELSDHAALDFLPRRLAGWILIAAAFIQRRAARRQVRRRNQNIGAAFVEIDAHPIAGLEQSEAAAGGGFGRRVKNGRRPGRAGLAAIADAGE